MENDKKQELVQDAIMEGVSSCCGANVYRPDICSDCKEHCEIESDDGKTKCTTCGDEFTKQDSQEDTCNNCA